MTKIKAWCDGSCVNGASSAMGYGILIRLEKDAHVAEIGIGFHVAAHRDNTNNVAELRAAIAALDSVDPVTAAREGMVVYCDSLYVINQAKGAWRTNTNHDLVRILQEMSRERNVSWVHVRGHTGERGNEICDELASRARTWEGDASHLIARVVAYDMHLEWPTPQGPQRNLVLSLEKGLLTTTQKVGEELWHLSIPPGYQ